MIRATLTQYSLLYRSNRETSRQTLHQIMTDQRRQMYPTLAAVLRFNAQMADHPWPGENVPQQFPRADCIQRYFHWFQVVQKREHAKRKGEGGLRSVGEEWDEERKGRTW